jgi:hypothetical protein
MFGLKGPKGWVPPEDNAREYLWFGALAYSLRGYDDTSLVQLVENGVTWWSDFSAHKIDGRPRGSGTWDSPEDFKNQLRTAVRKLHMQQEKVTREKVAEELYCDVSTLYRWRKLAFGASTSWREALRRL